VTETFDIDKFNLSKKDILEIINAISQRWRKSKISHLKNAQYIIGIEAMKVGINLTSEKVIQQIWRDILIGFNHIIEQNDAARMRNEYPDMKKMLDITKKKIANGELFDNKFDNDRNF